MPPTSSTHSILCPYCRFVMEIKGAKPGRFGPKCGSCGEKFVLTFYEDLSRTPDVRAHPDHGKAVATMPPAVKPAVQRTAVEQTGLPPKMRETIAPTIATQTQPPRVSEQPATAHRAEPKEPLPPDMGIPMEQGIRLGGYELRRKLGQGGMGAVYLARQLSLDRDVALKVLSPQLAADPQFVARFTREAYAAAQLTHHNVVQIHDIGIEHDQRSGNEVHFFSMEFVGGNTLARTLKAEGRLAPEVAAGYVLQAARGLKFAHDHGLIHRDVKPDNLLMNDQGIVKVADLGLVKVAGATENITAAAAAPQQPKPTPDATRIDATQMNVSMGTPAYMPPEQARDAAHVDQRADVYSLGCTLYDLLTGHPPFTGNTAYEVITKHSSENLVPPDRIDKHISPMLSDIVLRMTAKRPDDRFANMGQVVEALEGFLGVDSAKPFSPKQQHVAKMEWAGGRFNAAKWALIRTWSIRGFFALCLLLAVAFSLLWTKPLLAIGTLGFAVLTTVFYQVLVGVTGRTLIFRKSRQFLFGMQFADWAKLGFFAIVLGVLTVLLQLHWTLLGFAIAAAIAAGTLHFVVDKALQMERSMAVAETEKMLREMRSAALPEPAIRQFVARYAGNHWEEFYETLFGYEDKLNARRLWGRGEGGRERPKFGAWREPIINWIDQRSAHRKEERERKLLQKLEAKALRAKGMDEAAAARQAKKFTEQFVRNAALIRDSAAMRFAETALPSDPLSAEATMTRPPKSAPIPRTWVHAEVKIESEEEEGQPGWKHRSYASRRYGGPLDVLFGRFVRFVLAAIILAGFGMWCRINPHVLQPIKDVEVSRIQPQEAVERGLNTAGQVVTNVQRASTETQPLRIPMTPDYVGDAIGSWNGAAAGGLLLASCVFSGGLFGLVAVASAGLALVSHRFNLPFIHSSALIGTAAGAGLLLLGIVFLRDRE